MTQKEPVTLVKTSVKEIKSLFGNMGKKDGIILPDRPNKEWLLFGDPAIGHISITKLGRSDFPSNKWRGGGLWIHPDMRSQGTGISYMSAVGKYMFSKMPGPVKIVNVWTWTEGKSYPLYVRAGFSIIKSFDSVKYGNLTEFEKKFTEIDGKLTDLHNTGFIIHPGDFDWPFPIVK